MCIRDSLCCELFRENKHAVDSFHLIDGFTSGLSALEAFLVEAAHVPVWLENITSPHTDTHMKEHSRRDLPLCERHFRRKFKQIMGLTPSIFFRLQRFHHALRLRKENPRLELLDLISLCNFYDYSHFTREFKYFSGNSPSTFFQQPQPYRELMIPSLLFLPEIA